MKHGIDVSFWRGKPDWNKAKDSVDFALLAVTELEKGIDWTFEHNYQGCVANGIKVGAYSYSYAKDGADSRRWAEMVVGALNGRKLDLPIYLDLEWDVQKTYPQSRINDIIKQFREVVINAGYEFGIYCNKDWYFNRVPDFAKEYPLWLSWPVTDGNDCPMNLKPDYPNLGIWQYSYTGKVPGFGNDDVDMDVLFDDVKEESPKTSVTAEDALNVIRSWIGRSEADGSHKAIVDIYNNHRPLAQGYRLSYSDSWCDATVSAVFISLSATDLIGGTECGVERHVQLFKKAGIWNEDGTVIPDKGDIIVFNWDGATQPNDGFSDHIGLVEYVEGSIIHTIEGNAGGEVKRRTYRAGEGVIRGYAKPKYASEATEKPESPSDEDVVIILPPGDAEPSKTVYDRPELSYGCAGNDVKGLQMKLNTLGYFAPLDEDGIFGNLTRQTVMQLQKMNGLDADGIVGPKTWACLLNSLAALAVIGGYYGNGAERKERLTKDGYDYQAVQDLVNKMLS